MCENKTTKGMYVLEMSLTKTPKIDEKKKFFGEKKTILKIAENEDKE